MADGFCGPLFDLGLDQRSRRALVYEDAELTLVDEKTACRSLSIRVERDRLDREITNVPADHDTDETEEATGNRVHVLGAVLHTPISKHGPSSRKGSKTPGK